MAKYSLRDTSNMFAVMGLLTNTGTYTNKTKNKGQWRKIKTVRYHRKYRPPLYDIAIVFTEKSFILKKNVQMVKYQTSYQNYKGHCAVAGFGRTENDKPSPHLLVGMVTLIPIKECWRITGRKRKNQKTKSIICGRRNNNTATGYGDAGGPLYCGSGKTLKKNKTSIGYLIGIVSGSGEERNQGVIYFTRVSAFKRFIRRNDATQLAEYSFYSFHNNFMICYYLALIMSLH
ncbi:hypothetical protein JYU34_017150 [Plutella xylostella]|uniref:Peptidase S1 domain-containing protein n=1 Tax=Plutella xylostella TaxID=51655 RepID=A0ABQ7Q0I3_PLUXY|nr:hypothetical protein JYU34_017150 [Plutella xylostella]